MINIRAKEKDIGYRDEDGDGEEENECQGDRFIK